MTTATTDKPEKRSRGAANRDREVLDNIAALLNAPINCTRAQLADHDAAILVQVAALVEATGR